MSAITISIPDQFLQVLDELVAQTPGVGSREEWIKNFLRNFLVDYQVKKQLGQQYQQMMTYLMGFWP